MKRSATPSGKPGPAHNGSSTDAATKTVGRLVSLKTLAEMWDADRSTVRRWLREAAIEPVAIGRGRNGAIRYRWHEIQAWLESLERVD